jgi:hypothetical protein
MCGAMFSSGLTNRKSQSPVCLAFNCNIGTQDRGISACKAQALIGNRAKQSWVRRSSSVNDQNFIDAWVSLHARRQPAF